MRDGLHRVTLTAQGRCLCATGCSARDLDTHRREQAKREGPHEAVQERLLRFYLGDAGRALGCCFDRRRRNETVDERQSPRLLDGGGAKRTPSLHGCVVAAGREDGENDKRRETIHAQNMRRLSLNDEKSEIVTNETEAKPMSLLLQVSTATFGSFSCNSGISVATVGGMRVHFSRLGS